MPKTPEPSTNSKSTPIVSTPREATPKPSESLLKWEAVLAKISAENRIMEDQLTSESKFFSTRGGVLRLNDSPIPDNRMQVVVIDRILENDYYEGAFDPDILSLPVCYALGRTLDEMKPHADSTKPQSPQCQGCIQNQYGSRTLGRGKACQNRVRMALIAEKGLQDVDHALVKYLKIPPTNLQVWKSYVSQLDDLHHCPTWAVVTEISLHPDPKWNMRFEYKMVRKVERDLLTALQNKVTVVRGEIEFPYSTTNDAAGSPTQLHVVQPARR